MMKRMGTPWMPAPAFGRSLTGLGHNLLVSSVPTMTGFLRDVLDGHVVYEDPDFAVVNVSDGALILHADHTYDDHPYSAAVRDTEVRGAGLEIRLYAVDPDRAQLAAEVRGHTVLDASSDKPHGLREVFILGPDGYCFVPSRPLDDTP